MKQFRDIQWLSDGCQWEGKTGSEPWHPKNQNRKKDFVFCIFRETSTSATIFTSLYAKRASTEIRSSSVSYKHLSICRMAPHTKQILEVRILFPYIIVLVVFNVTYYEAFSSYQQYISCPLKSINFLLCLSFIQYLSSFFSFKSNLLYPH